MFLIATVIFMIVCGCRLIQIVLRYQEADRLYDDIEKEVFEPDIPAEDGKNQKDENDTGVKPTVDFHKLISINEDVVGWISIPELDLEYPITQGEDNEYYLHHAYNSRQILLAAFSWIIGIWKIFRTRTQYCMDIIC